MTKQADLFISYAAKFAAETVFSEPPSYVEPTDEALAAAFKNCGKVPDLDMLPKIRAAFNRDYALDITKAGVAYKSPRYS